MDITTTGMKFDYYEAAMEGRINAFEEKSGEQIESMLTPNENTILHIHCTNYRDSVSETFVDEVLRKCPALLLKTNVKDETILHIAARYGHQEIVKKLIDHAGHLTGDFNEIGAKERLIRALNDKKDTALHEAARYGHMQVVQYLINGGPNLSNFGENDGGETPLYIAIERRYWNVVDTILDNTNPPQYNGPNGRTALHAATIFGDEEKVLQLLTRNSLLAKQADKNGWVPLHLAAIVGRSKIVKLLVSKDKSTAYMRDNLGRTALHLAALYANVSAMEKILQDCPDCCELVDTKGCNALHYTSMDKASYFPHIALKEILKNAPLMRNLCNEKDDDGNTPLHYVAYLASKRKHRSNHVLLEPQFQGVVDTMACNKYGQNPLDVLGADMTPNSTFQNHLFRKLEDIGAMLGGRVLDQQLREKKQEKRHDPAFDEKEKENIKNGSGMEKSISIVAVLIATVTFAAGFTLPGGLHPDKGSPILKNNAAFKAFIIADSISFGFSATAILLLLFLSIKGKTGKSNEFYDPLPYSCLMYTMLAMGFMVIAFGTGLYAVLGVSKGLGVFPLYVVSSFFVLIFGFNLLKGRKNPSMEIRYRHDDYPLFRVRDTQLSDIV